MPNGDHHYSGSHSGRHGAQGARSRAEIERDAKMAAEAKTKRIAAEAREAKIAAKAEAWVDSLVVESLAEILDIRLDGSQSPSTRMSLTCYIASRIEAESATARVGPEPRVARFLAQSIARRIEAESPTAKDLNEKLKGVIKIRAFTLSASSATSTSERSLVEAILTESSTARTLAEIIANSILTESPTARTLYYSRKNFSHPALAEAIARHEQAIEELEKPDDLSALTKGVRDFYDTHLRNLRPGDLHRPL